MTAGDEPLEVDPNVFLGAADLAHGDGNQDPHGLVGRGVSSFTGLMLALLAQLSRAAAAFISGVIVARELGAEGRGEVALGLTVAGIATLAAMVGTNQALVELSTDGDRRAERLLPVALAFGAVCSGVATAVVALALLGADRTDTWRMPAPAVVLGAIVGGTLLQHALQVALLAGRAVRAAAVTCAAAAANVAAVVALAVGGSLTPTRALVAWAATSIAAPLAVLLWLDREAAWRRPRRADVERARRASLTAGIGALAVMAVWRLDLVVIGWQLGAAAAGNYSLATAVAEIVFVGLVALRMALLPRHADPEALPGTAAAVRLGLTAALIPAAAVAIAAPLVIELFYGEGFDAAVTPARMLVPGTVLLALHLPLFDQLTAAGDGRWLLRFGGCLLAGQLVALALLLPSTGIAGAAAISTVAYVAAFVAMVGRTHRVLGVPVRHLLVPRRGDASAVTGMVRSLARPRGSTAEREPC